MSKTFSIFYNNAKYELIEMNCLRGITFLIFLLFWQLCLFCLIMCKNTILSELFFSTLKMAIF